MSVAHRPASLYVMEHTKGPLMIAEVGVFKGGNALALLQMNTARIYLVDPYLAYSQKGIAGYNQQQLDEAMLEMIRRMRGYYDKVTIILQKSEAAAAMFPAEHFDYVYIDGDHNYEAARVDILAWYTNVKKGGFLAGHDYNLTEVARAVNEFAKVNGLELKTWVDAANGRKDWLVRKPEGK